MPLTLFYCLMISGSQKTCLAHSDELHISMFLALQNKLNEKISADFFIK